MRLFYKYFLLIFFLPLQFFSQEIDSSKIECKYLITFLIDTANINTLRKENASLLIGTHISLFKSDQKQIADSLTLISVEKSVSNPVNGQIEINTSSVPAAKFKPEVFYEKGKLTIYDEISKEHYHFAAPDKIAWKIENDTKIIQGYHCRKAISKYGNKLITVWYTDQIPIQEGPYTFKGLPGLVLEAYDSKDYFHFTLMGLKKIKKPIGKLPFGIDTTYEKFYKKRKEKMDDPLGSFFTAFGRPAPKDSEERIIKNIRSINNFLD
ncbi:GLPGLI family protein [Chryseobacterium sp. SIMBA_029]|uniref:GLPGLI family protein n=1 Tax=Chryseobacterium sp. SIMBA_029 TaxID=3085772 RepID=UPI0039781339